ncbi:hypothetical protein FOZ63_001157 [Perkinsus olseni]|uniref:Uncharacterized protein n=1 Tax=Perkinsus olseni TaxID=32597 RepID=A0A7J6QN09_PEROL|nr:hypothetical protein FOZ63_001157 [Perkinsus olseni]
MACRSHLPRERYDALSKVMGREQDDDGDTQELEPLMIDLMGILGCAMARLRSVRRARLVFRWCLEWMREKRGRSEAPCEKELVTLFNLAVCSLKLGSYEAAFAAADEAVKGFIESREGDDDAKPPPLQLIIIRLTAARKAGSAFDSGFSRRLTVTQDLLTRETQMWADFAWVRDRVELLRLEAALAEEALMNPRRSQLRELPGRSISMVRRRVKAEGGGDRQRFQETAVPPTDKERLAVSRHTATSLLHENSSVAELRVVADSLVRYGGPTPLGALGVSREMLESHVAHCEVRVSYPGLPLTVAGSPICVVIVLHGTVGRYRFSGARDVNSTKDGFAELCDDATVSYEKVGTVRAGEWILLDSPLKPTSADVCVVEGKQHVEVAVIPKWVFSRLLHEVVGNLKFSPATEFSSFLFDCAALFSKPSVSRLFTEVGGYKVENLFHKKRYRLRDVVFEPCKGERPPGLIVVMKGELKLMVVGDDRLEVGMARFGKEMVLERADALGLDMPNPLEKALRHDIVRALGLSSEKYLTEERLKWWTTLVPGDVLCVEALVGGWGVSHICSCEVVSLTCELLIIPPRDLTDADHELRMRPLVEALTMERDEDRAHLVERIRGDSLWRRKKAAIAKSVRAREKAVLPRHMVRNFV